MKKTIESNHQSTESLVKSILSRYQPYLTENEFSLLQSELTSPPVPALRVNCLKVDPVKGIDEWKERYHWTLKSIPYYPFGWQIVNTDRSISQTVEHRMGYYYLQDAASMLPVSMFDVEKKSGMMILDMAASPGGKTTQIFDRIGDKSLVIANDSSTSRLQALRVVLQNWGAINFFSTNFPGEKFGEWFPEVFDLILLDAPCSMENLRPTSTHPFRSTTPNERFRLAERQVNLLISAFKALKPGGQLVYSTCTLAPEEDEAVVDKLIKLFPHSTEILENEKFEFKAPGLVEFMGANFDPAVKHSIRLWPHILGTSGFFAVRIKKISSLRLKSTQYPTRDFQLTGLVQLKPSERQQLSDLIMDSYGFDLSKVTQQYSLELMHRRDNLFLVPQKYLSYFSQIPFHTLGMSLGKMTAGNILLTHEFVSRFGPQFAQGIIILDDQYIDQWLAGRDIRGPYLSPNQIGSIVLVKDLYGRILGSGKVLPERIRNLLPQRLV